MLTLLSSRAYLYKQGRISFFYTVAEASSLYNQNHRKCSMQKVFMPKVCNFIEKESFLKFLTTPFLTENLRWLFLSAQ